MVAFEAVKSRLPMWLSTDSSRQPLLASPLSMCAHLQTCAIRNMHATKDYITASQDVDMCNGENGCLHSLLGIMRCQGLCDC